MREWQRIGGVILVALACATAPLLGTDGPLTVAPNLRVRTDTGSGYLLVTAGAYSGADGPYTNFGNIKLRTDQNGYLLVSGTGLTGTITGSSAVGDILLGTGGTSFGRLADVAINTSVLVSQGVGVAPAWSTSPTLSGVITANFNGGGGFVINGTTPDAGVTGQSYATIQTGGVSRWFVGMSPCAADGAFAIANNVNAGCAISFAKAANSNATMTGTLTIGTLAFAALGTPANGTVVYCSDCTETTAATCPVTQASCVCTNGGAGAFARRIAAAWYCTF